MPITHQVPLFRLGGHHTTLSASQITFQLPWCSLGTENKRVHQSDCIKSRVG